MKPTVKLHVLAGAVALATISTFWLSTALAELFGSEALIRQVKAGVLWGFALLIPSMVLAGASGNRLTNGMRGRAITRKKLRMFLAATNGILILMPAAVFLHLKAQAGEIDRPFFLVQAVELVAGSVNITLLALNIRDGRRLGGGRRQAARKAPSDQKPSQSAL